MVEVTHTLKHDHRVIERVLRALQGICLRIERQEQVPAAALTGVFDFISTFAETFHRGKEERFLLPALARFGLLEDQNAVNRAVHEHRTELETVDSLRAAIDLYSRGEVSSSHKVVELARRYIELMVEHFQSEDNVLFRLVEEVLDDGAKASLLASMKSAEMQLGANGRRRYEELAESLESEWAL